MDMAYHDLNQREYELTRHVTLLQVNPLALLQLRTTGRCTVILPEELYDKDGPGQLMKKGSEEFVIPEVNVKLRRFTEASDQGP